MSYNSATSRLRCTAGSTGRLLRADAGDLTAYAKAVPADLVLMAGVFGNISDADVRRTIGALPQLCADGATVIWTRTRRAPDLTLTGQAWSPWAAGVLSGGPRRRTDGEDPAQRVPGVKGAPCFGPQGLQGRVTGVRRCDRLLPQRSLGLPPVGPVLHLDVHEPGRPAGPGADPQREDAREPAGLSGR